MQDVIIIGYNLTSRNVAFITQALSASSRALP